MNKEVVYRSLLEKLRSEFQATVQASKDAADYATNPESRAESKYDTQGLEASYLAAGQATKARELAESIERLKGLEGDLTAPQSMVRRGAMVQCSIDGRAEWFFLTPEGGGEEFEANGTTVSGVNPRTPLGSAMGGKKEGDSFVLPSGLSGTILQVL